MEIENIKKSEIKNTITEMKNTLQGINSRVDEQRIKSAIWKLRKQKTPQHNSKKKKEPKN